ncbi:MAG: hypothetical protein WCR06_09470, partial [bacterium]
EAAGNSHHEGHEEHEVQLIRQFRLFPASDYVNLRVLRIFVVEAAKVALHEKTMHTDLRRMHFLLHSAPIW